MEKKENMKEPPEIGSATIRIKPDLSDLKKLLQGMLAVIDRYQDD